MRKRDKQALRIASQTETERDRKRMRERQRTTRDTKDKHTYTETARKASGPVIRRTKPHDNHRHLITFVITCLR